MNTLKNTIKIYVDNSTILLTNDPNYLNNTNLKISRGTLLQKIILDIVSNKITQTYLFSCENPKESLNNLKKNLKYIQAAGGIVKNTFNEYLLIYRRNLWDLPKGKVEPNEDLKMAALREVKEETGITVKDIISFVDSTWHCYLSDNQIIIKETYWYLMQTIKQDGIPQLEEEITQVLWANKSKAKELITKNSLPLIIDLIDPILLDSYNNR